MILCILYGAMAVGEANTYAPNYAKAKLAASHLMMLIHRKPFIDNLSEEGASPVNKPSPPQEPGLLNKDCTLANTWLCPRLSRRNMMAMCFLNM